MRLRAHLIALVLAVLLPMIAFSALAIVMLDRYQRTNTERAAVELARALMTAVDEALRSTITTPVDPGELAAIVASVAGRAAT